VPPIMVEVSDMHVSFSEDHHVIWRGSSPPNPGCPANRSGTPTPSVSQSSGYTPRNISTPVQDGLRDASQH
jgi:hypothetical protein